jgi:hypothetical protein
MRRRLLVLFLAAFVLTLGAVAFFSLRGEREPEYQGRKLSQWIALYDQPVMTMRFIGMPTPSDPNREAIQRIGTNAIPWLIKWILYEEPGWQAWLKSKLDDRLVERLHFVDATERRNRGAAGFMALGDAAAPAIPALTSVIDGPGRDSVKADAVGALSCIGRAAVPALLQTIRKNGPKSWLSVLAISYLSTVQDLGTNSEETGGVLRAYVTGGDADIACGAARALAVHRLQPALSVPVLATQLEESTHIWPSLPPTLSPNSAPRPRPRCRSWSHG